MDKELYELCMDRARASPSIRETNCRSIANQGEIDPRAKLCYTLMFEFIPKSHTRKRDKFLFTCINLGG